MKWAASELLTTSTSWMLLAHSWPMRWKMRSPPERSTRMEMPGYFCSKALAMCSATGRSTAVYQITLPSFFAASIRPGVTWVSAGACARAARPKRSGAAERACRRRRRPMVLSSMDSFSLVSGYQRPAPLGRQHQPHRRAGSKCRRGSRRHPQLRAALGLEQVVAGRAEEVVADHGRLHRVARGRASVAGDRDVVLADGDRRSPARRL